MKSYLITDPSIYTHQISTFAEKLEQALLAYQPDFALYRDKNFNEYDSFASIFVEICHKHHVKAMIHNNAPLADRLNAYGVHFSSDKICSIGRVNSKLYQVLSTHKSEEIQSAFELGIDAVTFSPIFDTPNKGEAQGIDVLKDIVETSPLPIIALGGIISEEQIQAVKASQAWAFASIRYFTDTVSK